MKTAYPCGAADIDTGDKNYKISMASNILISKALFKIKITS